MKLFWLALIPASIWGVFGFHEMAQIDLRAWYGYPLIVTYVSFIIGMIAIALNKGMK